MIFNLREQARFQDGEPITAEDVEFSYRILTTEGHPFYRNYYADVSKVTVENSHRIRFDFGATENRELPLILGQMPVMPAHYWVDRKFEGNGLDVPVGSGPYRIDSYEAGRSLTYERVDDYWAEDLGIPRAVSISVASSTSTTTTTPSPESFKAGNFDLRVETSAKNWATATGRGFDNGGITKEAVEHHRPSGMQGFVFNTRKQCSKTRRYAGPGLCL